MEASNFTDHISRRFNKDIEDLRNTVLSMGGLVETQLSKAIAAIVSGDSELGLQVANDDYKVNNLEVEIDEECSRILATRAPAAGDLRLIVAIIKTITDLERIGDEAKRVARMVEEELNGAMAEDVRHELEHMGNLVREMLRMILDAFARLDVESAVRVVKADNRVDVKYVSITRQLMTYMAQDPKSIPRVLNILWAARAMERMGDRCGNIAEYIFYLVHGRDIRHTELDDAVIDIAAGTGRHSA